jgi:lipoprotein-anchoring transpeptidase ErfK/SrfK
MSGCVLLAALAHMSAPADASEIQARHVEAPNGAAVAQNSAISMHVDAYGREIYVDRRTGRVLAIRGPRSNRMAPAPGNFPPAPPMVDYGFGIEEPLQGGDTRFYRDQFGTNRMWRDPAQHMAPQTAPETAPAPSPPSVRRKPLPKAVETPAPKPDATQKKPAEIAAIKPDKPEKAAHADPALVARIQILLDRHGFSPGVIDGQYGPNMQKALDAWKTARDTDLLAMNMDALDAALEESGGSAFQTYTISQADRAGPFVAAIPADYGQKARMEKLAFTSVREMLAETFHMDEDYLARLNPGANFSAPGTEIRVARPGKARQAEISRIVADKGQKQVRAYDGNGTLLAAYPATIGSLDTPSPSGTVTVERIAFDPNYTYNPRINFKQGDNDRILTIPPGPNGPVGSVWIALSKPTYGIHGTPKPDRIGKSYSNGCIRLTNWDAYELARMVKPGVTVEFID